MELVNDMLMCKFTGLKDFHNIPEAHDSLIFPLQVKKSVNKCAKC